MRSYILKGFLLALVGALLIGTAQAASVGISFMSNRGNPAAQLLKTEVAGVVPQANWNTNDGGLNLEAAAVGTTADMISPTAGVLVDDSGAATGVTVNWVADTTWNTTNGTATGDAKLMNGYIDAVFVGQGTGNTETSTVTLASIPYPAYDLYVYFGSDGNGRSGQVTDGTTTYSYNTYSNNPYGGGGFVPSDYTQTTETGSQFPLANYAVFSDLTSSSVTVDIIHGGSNGLNSGIHGVQIVQVPEPVTVFLLGMGLVVLGVVVRRRSGDADRSL